MCLQRFRPEQGARGFGEKKIRHPIRATQTIKSFTRNAVRMLSEHVGFVRPTDNPITELRLFFFTRGLKRYTSLSVNLPVSISRSFNHPVDLNSPLALAPRHNGRPLSRGVAAYFGCPRSVRKSHERPTLASRRENYFSRYIRRKCGFVVRSVRRRDRRPRNTGSRITNVAIIFYTDTNVHYTQ